MGGDLLFALVGFDAVCLYIDRYRTKHRGNLGLRPLFSGGFRFALFGLVGWGVVLVAPLARPLLALSGAHHDFGTPPATTPSTPTS
jgi:hypothetical protein